MDYKIVSVESRKGGVGKTTAALNLATVLLEKNYAVLFLDVDITGTSIMGAFKSSYWKDKVNPIKQDRKDINLLRLFQEEFLIGEDVAKFSDNWLIDDSKINVLQSVIYQSDPDGKFECDPRILFDELHSYWLINMLKSICDKFKSTVNKEVVIILDNSPGFVGLTKSIHEWLLEIGPDNGKFLSVSSLDIQDLKSTIQAIRNIDNDISNRKQAIEKFKEIQNQQSNINTIQDNIKDLIVKFVTSGDTIQFKYSKTTSLSKYQALIVNKVPTIISNKTILYDFSELELDDNIVSELLYSKSSSKIKNYVNFDNRFNYQFIEANLYRKTNKTRSPSWRLLKERIIEIREKDSDMIKPNNILDKIEKYQNNILNINRLLQSSKLKYLTEIIDEKWFPKTPFQDLSDKFENLISDFPFHFTMRIHRDDIYIRENKYMIDQIENFISDNFKIDLNTNETTIVLIRYLLLNAFYSYIFKPKEIENIFTPLFKSIMEIQKYRVKKNIKQTYKQFLASEDISDTNELIDWSQKTIHLIENSRMHGFFEDSSFVDFYNSFCHAQARLIDLLDDYQFLLYALEFMISEDSKSNQIVFPNINDTLNQVIIDKSIPHSQAKEKLAESIYAAKFMVDFNKELQSISKEWGLIK